jgi:glutaredoxin
MLRLYTKNDCVYCDVMKEKLAEWGVTEYNLINVSVNDIGLNYLKSQGLRTVPQLMIDDVSLNAGIDTREFTREQFFDRLSAAGTKQVKINVPKSV